MAAMRPLMAADPMLRAPSPEMVSESNRAGPVGCGAPPLLVEEPLAAGPALRAAGAAALASGLMPAITSRCGPRAAVSEASGSCIAAPLEPPAAGLAKRLSLSGMLASMRLYENFCRFALPRSEERRV